LSQATQGSLQDMEQLDERAPALSEALLLDLHGKKGNAFTSLRVSVAECNVWKKDETSSNELQ